MIQFIVMMFSLMFSNGKETSHSTHNVLSIQNNVNQNTIEQDGPGGATTGDTGQTPPPFAKF